MRTEIYSFKNQYNVEFTLFDDYTYVSDTSYASNVRLTHGRLRDYRWRWEFKGAVLWMQSISDYGGFDDDSTDDHGARISDILMEREFLL